MTKTKMKISFTNTNCEFFLYYKTYILNLLIITSTVFITLKSAFAICSLLSQHLSLGLTNSTFKITLENIACF